MNVVLVKPASAGGDSGLTPYFLVGVLPMSTSRPILAGRNVENVALALGRSTERTGLRMARAQENRHFKMDTTTDKSAVTSIPGPGAPTISGRPRNRMHAEREKTQFLLQELPPVRRQSMLEFRVEPCTP